jgi:hypothetical protein
MGEFLDGLGDAGYIAAAIGSNLFVVLYSSLAKFWRHVEGWHIFSFMLVIALIFDHSAILVATGGYPGADWVRAILYPALGAVIFWRVVILLRVQLAGRGRLPMLTPEDNMPDSK